MSQAISVTRCPECKAAFHITDRELNAAKGRVRCGNCLRIFTATDHLIVEQKSLFENAFNSLNQAAHPHQSGIEDTERDDPFFMQRVEPPTRSKHRLAWGIVALGLILLPPIQLLIWQPVQLSRYDWYSQFLQQSCEILGCTLRPIEDIDLLEVVGAIHTSEYAEETLVADIALINHAHFSQPLPNIVLQFKNMQGRETASRELLPSDYLQTAVTQTPTANNPLLQTHLNAKERLMFRIYMTDPGRDSANYEFWARSHTQNDSGL